MAKRISKDDISDSDVFSYVIEGAKSALDVINELNDGLKKTAETLSKDVKGAKFGSSKDLEKFTKATREANKTKEDSIKLDQQKAKLIQEIEKIEQQSEKTKQQKIKTQQQENRLSQQETAQKEKENKARQRAIKLKNDENNAYKQLVKQTRDQKNESKKLAVELINLERAGKKNSKEWRKLNTQYKNVTRSAKQGDKALKKIDATVGDNFRNVGNYKQALGKLTTILSGLGLAFGGFQLIRGAGETIADFGQNIADLKAITGAGGRDLEFFRQQAIEMGKDVEGGASAVIEAYKLIASAKPELLNNAEALDQVTQSAIKLSHASGMELPEASTRLTDALNQFGAPAEDAGKFIDVLANGAKFGSAEIPQITDALLKFGAVAKTTNVSVAESTALIEALAEKGLKGAEAGTALRNVMLKLSAPDALPKKAQDALNKLGISFEDLTDESKPFSERLEALKPLLNDSGALMKVFGKENSVAAISLLENTDRIEELTDLMDKNGTATEQAEERTNTLAHAFLNLKESWNSFILSVDQGGGIGEKLKSFIGFLADNLGTIVTVVYKVVRAWALYKGALLGAKAVTFLFGGGLQDMYKQMIKSVKGFKLMGRGAKKMGKDVQKAGRMMNAVPWMLIIALVVELASAFWDIASGAQQARIQAEAYRKAEENALKNVEKMNEKIAKRVKEQFDLIEEQRAKGEIDAKKEAELKKTVLDAEVKNTKQLINSRKEQRKFAVEKMNETKAEIARLEELAKKQSIKDGNKLETQDAIRRLEQEDLVNFTKLARQRRLEVEGLVETNKQMVEQARGLNNEILSEETNLKNLRNQQNKTTKSTKTLNAEFSNQIKLFEELNELKEESLEIDRDIREVYLESKIGDIEEGITKEIELQEKSAEETGKVNFKLLDKLFKDKQNKQIELANWNRQFELDQAQKEHDAKFKALQESLDKEKKEKLAQAGLTPEQKQKILDGYKREQDDLDKVREEAEKVLWQKLYLINQEGAEEIKKIERDNAEEIKLIKEGLVDDTTQYEIEKEEEKVEKLKKLAEDSKAIARAVADFFIAQSQKKIDQADKEIKQAEKHASTLEQLAINGNIKAKESLAEQNRLIAEATKRKIAEERKQQAIKQATIILETYLSKVEQNVKNPLVETIRDVGLLTSFLQTISANSYEEGTEDTGAHGQGIDGKGGFHAVLHPNERVLTKEQNKKIGDLSNEELANFARDYQTGQIIGTGEGGIQIGSGWNTGAIVDRLESLENTIKNKPETELRVEDIVQGAMTITRETKQGNTKVYNRYKIK